MLLDIYFVTTLLSWVIAFGSLCASVPYIKRKGYVFTKNNKSFIENLFMCFTDLVKLSIPVYNVLIAFDILVNVNSVSEDILMDLLSRDLIAYEPAGNKSNDVEKTNSSTIDDNKNYSEENEKTIFGKDYNEMTREEKLAVLEREREYLLNSIKDEPEHTLSKVKK